MQTENQILLVGVNSSISNQGPEPKGFGEFLKNISLLDESAEGPVHKVVCIDYNRCALREIRRRDIDAKKATLIRMEPSVVLPANFSKARRRQFSRIISLGGIPGEAENALPWPQDWESKLPFFQEDWKPRAEKTVLVNSHKLSLIGGELYSLRRKCLMKLVDVDLYGPGWNSPLPLRIIVFLKSLLFTILNGIPPKVRSTRGWFQQYTNWQGTAQDKIRTMSSYKYALVIENSAEYMSEKLFDAFFAGCLPIYVGPPVEKFGIPENLVFQAEANLDSISRAINQARVRDHQEYLRDLKSYLESGETISKWSRESVYSRILEIVNKKE